MEEHFAAIRTALRKLDTSPGSPAELALAELTLLEAKLTPLRKDARSYRDTHNHLQQVQNELERRTLEHDRVIEEHRQWVAEIKTENTRIREQHRQLAGEAGAVIHSLQDQVAEHAKQLLAISRKAP